MKVPENDSMLFTSQVSEHSADTQGCSHQETGLTQSQCESSHHRDPHETLGLMLSLIRDHCEV